MRLGKYKKGKTSRPARLQPIENQNQGEDRVEDFYRTTPKKEGEPVTTYESDVAALEAFSKTKPASLLPPLLEPTKSQKRRTFSAQG